MTFSSWSLNIPVWQVYQLKVYGGIKSCQNIHGNTMAPLFIRQKHILYSIMYAFLVNWRYRDMHILIWLISTDHRNVGYLGSL